MICLRLWRRDLADFAGLEFRLKHAAADRLCHIGNRVTIPSFPTRINVVGFDALDELVSPSKYPKACQKFPL
jgi:hypothetical protein